LVTAAGFLPVGFARSSAGEYAGGIFWVVAVSLINKWIVAVVFTPYLGLKLLPDLAKPGVHRDPDLIYDTRIYRVLRSVIKRLPALAQDGRRHHDAHVRHCDRRLRPGAAAVLSDVDAHRAVLRNASPGGHR